MEKLLLDYSAVPGNSLEEAGGAESTSAQEAGGERSFGLQVLLPMGSMLVLGALYVGYDAIRQRRKASEQTTK